MISWSICFIIDNYYQYRDSQLSILNDNRIRTVLQKMTILSPNDLIIQLNCFLLLIHTQTHSLTHTRTEWANNLFRVINSQSAFVGTNVTHATPVALLLMMMLTNCPHGLHQMTSNLMDWHSTLITKHGLIVRYVNTVSAEN